MVVGAVVVLVASDAANVVSICRVAVAVFVFVAVNVKLVQWSNCRLKLPTRINKQYNELLFLL